MKKLLLISIFIFICSIFAESIDDIKFMTEPYPPYNFVENHRLKGIAVDILEKIFEKMDSKLDRKDIKIFPWARSYDYIQHKKNISLFSMTRNESRENLFKWVGPIIDTEIGLIALKNRNIKIKTIEDIKKYKIGTIRSDIGEILLLKNKIPLKRIQRVGKTLHNIKKLIAKRVDIWAYDLTVAKWELKSNGYSLDDFEVVYVFKKSTIYYAFSKNISNKLIDRIQKAFDEIKVSDEYKKIVDRYLDN